VDAVRHCPIDLGPDGPSVRGKSVIVTRIGKHKNAPVRVEFTSTSLYEDQLPEPFDVRRALERLWGIGSIPPQPD